MLCLSRYEGEKIIIGNGITVQVMRARGGQARLAIDAPADVLVLREELFERDPDSIPTFWGAVHGGEG